MTRREPTLESARIHRNYIGYHVLATNWPLVVFIFTIPILFISVPLSYWIYARRYDRLRVTLHPKTLKIKQGILMVNEKTIPLNKITDLAIFHGPIMRWMGLKGLRVETAGQSGAGGALATVIGIIKTDDFRDTVLDQRDHVVEQQPGASAQDDPGRPPADQKPPWKTVAAEGASADATLIEIRDTLKRIEQALVPEPAVVKKAGRKRKE